MALLVVSVKVGRRKKKKEEKRRKKKEERKNAPTETSPLPESHAQDLCVNRVRGNHSLRLFMRLSSVSSRLGAEAKTQLSVLMKLL